MRWDDPLVLAEDAEAREALLYLRQLLGDDWPGWSEWRPLWEELLRPAPLGVVRVASLLRHIESDPCFPEVIVDLGSSTRELCVGAQNVLTVAGGLRERGSIVELIKRAPPRKTPDFRAELAGRWVTFEAAALQPSGAVQKADAVRASLAEWAYEAGIASSWFVTVDVELTPSEVLFRLEDLKRQIEEAVSKEADAEIRPAGGTIRVQKGQGPIPVLVNGLILDRFSGVANQWETRRILGKIREKSAQLEEEQGPSVIIVRNDTLFVPAHLTNMENAIDEMAKCILDVNALPALAHVSAVLDYEEWTGSLSFESRALRGESYYATVGSGPDAICRAMVLTLNPTAVTPLDFPEIKALLCTGLVEDAGR